VRLRDHDAYATTVNDVGLTAGSGESSTSPATTPDVHSFVQGPRSTSRAIGPARPTASSSRKCVLH